MKKILLAASVVFCMFANVALAEVKTGLYVKYLQKSEGGNRVFVQFSTSNSVTAAAYVFSAGCKYNHALIVDSSTSDGQNIYSMLMSAFIHRLPLEINANSCDTNYPFLIEAAFGKYQ